MEKVYIIIPTYNEKENIALLLKEIINLNPTWNILVVDDDSPDRTWQIVQDYHHKFPQIALLRRVNKPRGRGLAGKAGFLKALELGAEKIIEMDADFSHHPRYLSFLLTALEQFDFVLGSRYVPGGQDSNRSFKRTFLSKFANFYLRHLFGIKVQDCTSGFRGYRRSVLEKIQLNTLNTPGPALLADILFRASLLNLKIGEIPIVFTDRRAGHSQFNFQKIAEGFLHPLRLKFNQRKIKNLLTS